MYKIIRVLVGVIFISIFLGENTFSYEIRVESQLSQGEFDTIKDIVGKAEAFRGTLEEDTKYSLKIIDTLDGEVKASNNIESFVKVIPPSTGKSYQLNGGDVLVDILSGKGAPARILQKDVNMWYYKQGTKNSIRISPAQRLLGGASYSDVSSTNYQQFYDPIHMETLTLGDRPTYNITLKQVKRGVAYNTIHLFVDKATFRPRKAEFSTASGKRLKTMYFRKFATLNNRTISTQWIIVDGLNSKAVTYINVLDLSNYSLPSSKFTTTGMRE